MGGLDVFRFQVRWTDLPIPTPMIISAGESIQTPEPRRSDNTLRTQLVTSFLTMELRVILFIRGHLRPASPFKPQTARPLTFPKTVSLSLPRGKESCEVC
jgi:hypothetical protein